MTAIIYDSQVERFEPLLVEGRVYYVRMMVVQSVMSLKAIILCCFHLTKSSP
jgi:hypothetical protein